MLFFVFFFLLSLRIIIKRKHSSGYDISLRYNISAEVSLKLMLHKFSTKSQQLFNFRSLFFVLAAKSMFPPSSVRPSIRKIVCCLWQRSTEKPARAGSTPAVLLLFHSHHSSKWSLRSPPVERQDEGTALTTEDLPPLIFSHWLADATKPFSYDTAGLSNTCRMKTALAMPQEWVFISQHHSSIFVQTNTYNKPNTF